MKGAGRAAERGLICLPVIQRQAGVIAWLPDTRPVRFVLVTSRRTGRWVFPKGSIESGQSAPDSAAREAFEEAGVVGSAEPRALGSFRTVKVRPPYSWTVEVAVYPLRVDEVLDMWPESDERQRRFVTLAEARPLLDERDMLRIAERFAGEG